MYFAWNVEPRKFAHFFQLRGSVSKEKERLKMQERKNKKGATNDANFLLGGNVFRKENKGGKQECG